MVRATRPVHLLHKVSLGAWDSSSNNRPGLGALDFPQFIFDRKIICLHESSCERTCSIRECSMQILGVSVWHTWSNDAARRGSLWPHYPAPRLRFPAPCPARQTNACHQIFAVTISLTHCAPHMPAATHESSTWGCRRAGGCAYPHAYASSFAGCAHEVHTFSDRETTSKRPEAEPQLGFARRTM